MEQLILRLLGRNDYTPADPHQLVKRLGLQPDSLPALQAALRKLEQSGQILRTKGHRYIQSHKADLVPGRIRINRQGKGFLEPDDAAQKEIVVPESATDTALHGDRVLVRREIVPGAKAQAAIGTVVRILERARKRIVGTLQRSSQFLIVIPDDPRIPHDIYVPPPPETGRKPQIGDKVVVELHAWESRHANPEGQIIEVLGSPDEQGVDMLSVLRNRSLATHFPGKVMQEAAILGRSRPRGEPLPGELAGRVDCRCDNVVTIDPDDAKDFDDAICLRRDGAGQWRLWVHIADVSHYVRAGGALDEEARRRGNSSYLVDRVIPMLPEELSNEICSLKPGVDRLTKCVEFQLSNEGKVLGTKFYPAVIRSRRRLTYKNALETLQRRGSSDAVDQMLHHAHELAQHIRRARFQAGSLELDIPETKIRLDAAGRVAKIERVENDISHQLVEEFMLLANEAVAARLMALRRPALYRVHEAPAQERLEEYRQDVLKHQIPCGNLNHRIEVQKLLRRLNGMTIGPALKIGFLRSLPRACYAVEPLGHYGLCKAKYTHFTSPIRRYADLLVHRALFDGEKPSVAALKPLAQHLCDTERNSADAERDSKDLKLFAYLRRQIKNGRAESYGARVIEVRNFGFFVDVFALGLSGMVHVSSLEDDFYVFDAGRGVLVGRRNRRVIRVGDEVSVQACKVDGFKKQVDFKLVRLPAKQTTEKGRWPQEGGRKAPAAADGGRPRPGALRRRS